MNRTGKVEVWNEWEYGKRLGAGSFGEVYEIKKESLGKTYTAALKIITIPQKEDIADAAYNGITKSNMRTYFQGYIKSITTEFSTMSELKGLTNIVSYEAHEVVEHKDDIGWDIYIRMELLTPLKTWLLTNDMTEVDVIHLGCDICTALEICQKKGILHRDIKPDNIFVNEYGNFKLGDFGIAKITDKTLSSHSQKGTLRYIAPEVYHGEEYGRTADIYSLGLVLFEYLNNGREPFLSYDFNPEYEDKKRVLDLRLEGQAPSMPYYGTVQLKAAIVKAISPLSNDRFQSADEFHRRLTECLSNADGHTILYRHIMETDEIESDEVDDSFPNLEENHHDDLETLDEDSSGTIITNDTNKLQENEKQSSRLPDFNIQQHSNLDSSVTMPVFGGQDYVQPTDTSKDKENVDEPPKMSYKKIAFISVGTVACLIVVILLINAINKQDKIKEDETLSYYSDSSMTSLPTTNSETPEIATTSEVKVESNTELSEEETTKADISNFAIVSQCNDIMLLGDTIQLQLFSQNESMLIFLDAKSSDFSWRSSDESVLTVIGGEVHAVGTGDAVVFCTSNGGYSSFPITVANVLEESSVSITPDTSTLALTSYTEMNVNFAINGDIGDAQLTCYTNKEASTYLSTTWGTLSNNTIPLTIKSNYYDSDGEKISTEITVLIYKDKTIYAATKIYVTLN